MNDVLWYGGETGEGTSGMRSGRRAGWTLGLFAVLFAAWPECSVSAPAKQQAALLLSSPTPALVQEVESEHQPTSQETAVVAVFWASVLQAQQTGSAPEIWYATDILSVVASLGGEYPALFATGGDGGLAPLSGDLRLRGSSPQLESPVAPPARSCHQTCLAASPWAYESLAENVISALAPFGSSAKVAADAVTVWDAVTAVGFRTHSIITLVMDLPEATTLPLVLDIGDVVLGTAGLLTLGTAAAPAIATAGAAWAAIEIGISLADAVSGYAACTAWKAMSCGRGHPSGPAKPAGPHPLGPAPTAVRGPHGGKGGKGKGGHHSGGTDNTGTDGTATTTDTGTTTETFTTSTDTTTTTDEITYTTGGTTGTDTTDEGGTTTATVGTDTTGFHTTHTGYHAIEPVRRDRVRTLAIASGDLATVSFAWRDAPGTAPSADLAVMVDGRPVFQVAALGAHPFARSGLDVVRLEPGATYTLEMSRAEDGLELSLRGPDGSVALAVDAPVEATSEEVARAVVVLPAPSLRAAVTAKFSQPDSAPPEALSEDSDADLADGMRYGDAFRRR